MTPPGEGETLAVLQGARSRRARGARPRPREDADARELRGAGAGRLGTAGEDAGRPQGAARRADRRVALAVRRAGRRVDGGPARRGGTAGPGARARDRERAADACRRGPAPRARALLAGSSRGAHRLSAERIEALARSLVRRTAGGRDRRRRPRRRPAPRDAERAIALLDVVLGSVGREGGFVARRPLPEAGTAAPRTGPADARGRARRLRGCPLPRRGRRRPRPAVAASRGARSRRTPSW